MTRDEQTVQLLVARDERGLHRLLQDYGHRVHAVLRREYRGVMDGASLDEVMNDAAYSAWQHANAFRRERGTLGGWFYIIARNAARSVLRKRLRQQPRTEPVDWDYLAVLESVRRRRSNHNSGGKFAALHECIAQLPPQQRKIIKADLRAGGLANTEELAQRLQTTSNSIYASRSVARRTLRGKLQQRGSPASGVEEG